MSRLLLLLLFVGLSTSHAQILYNTVDVTAPTTIAGEYAGGSGSWGVSLITTGPISGSVVLMDDGADVVTDGCTTATPENAAAINGNIVIIDRGTCSQLRKPFLAQNYGALAVILVNDRPGEVPYQSGGFEDLILIPMAYVTQEVGALLKANLDGLEVTLSGSELEIANAECVAGMAGAFPCDGINLEANLARSVFATPESPAPRAANDIWGWTDPETGREYALVGLTNGTAFVDVTAPTNPVYLGKLPTTTNESSWRDIKTYADHAFIVSEAPDHGMQVFDLTRLRTASGSPVTFEADALYTGITSAHNIVINEESGFAYAVGSRNSGGLPTTCEVRGLHAIDISTPTSPTFSSCFSDVAQETGPRTSRGYTHDAQCVMYDGPDADHAGKEICFAANEDVVSIFDVSDKANVALLSQTAYPNATYTHQGWLTDDHRYFVVNDEIDEIGFGGLTRTLVFDAFDLDSPDFSFVHEGGSEATDHNLYVHNGRIFQSNYRAGLRILDARDIADGSLTEIASFDTWPESNDVGTTGQWSNYPYFPSGTVVVNDTRGGLFVLSLADAPTLAEALDALASDVAALEADGTLNKGQANALRRKLTQTQRLLDRRKTAEALDVLAGFRQQVRDLETEGVLSAEQATALVASVDAISGLVASLSSADAIEGDDATTSAVNEAEAFRLAAPYPNPTTGRTTLAFSVEEATEVRLAVYDALGREVAVLAEGFVPAGRHERTLDGAELETGTYLVRLTTAEGEVATHRLTLLR